MIACFKNRFSSAVHNRIVRINFSRYKFFHYKLNAMEIFFMKCSQLIFILQFVCCCRTNTIIRLDNNRIAYFYNKFQTFRKIRHQMISGRRNSSLGIIWFHFRFIFHMFHIYSLHTRNIEIRPQSGILFQPVFIIAFKAIHRTMLIAQKSHCTVHLIIIFHIIHTIIFCQAVLNLI